MESTQLYRQRGEDYLQEYKYKEALHEFNEAVNIESENADNYGLKARALAVLDMWTEAKEACDKALSLNRSCYHAYHALGNVYKDLKDYGNAYDCYNKAIKYNPDFARAYYGRAGLHLHTHNGNKAALHDYSKAIEVGFIKPEAYYYRGRLLEDIGENEKALADYNKALELNNDSSITYYNRGILFEDMKEHDKAICDYNKAIEINKKNSKYYHTRARFYRSAKNLEKPYQHPAIEHLINHHNDLYIAGFL